MSGYTPVFGSVFDGTLCGKWPDTGVWVCLLALADWRGHIDMTPQAISVRLGIPLDALRECIARFCGPDSESRSKAEDGRRLVLLDPAREWGWRVVNIEVYRKKARDANDVSSGRAAERAREYRNRHAPSRAVTRHHDTHTADSNVNTDSEKNPQGKNPVGKNARKRATSASTVFPLDFALDDALRAQALKRAPDCDVDEAFVQFRAHHQARESKFVNWRQAWTTWVGNFEQFGYPKRRANGAPPGMEGVRW